MIETDYNIGFTASLALREKQIQQSYRPIIGIHKWFARRPGTVFRSLMLSEFGNGCVAQDFWQGHKLGGVIADPFMGGGTPIYEAVRLGFDVVGTDINPMAFWVVRQALAPLNTEAFAAAAAKVVEDVERSVREFYQTKCLRCGEQAEIKYCIWVKVDTCPHCGKDNDLFPSYQLSKAERHPRHVIVCHSCGELNEYQDRPTKRNSNFCLSCGGAVYVEGPAQRGKCECRYCEQTFLYPADSSTPPRHRLWAVEYHCATCKPNHKGRFFKRPDEEDLAQYERASHLFEQLSGELPIPSDYIPSGDETDRLHRWGYHRYREMFNPRQLLGLGLLLKRLLEVNEIELRYALVTVFSDFLRYQNMLCRYDTYALKCQDIFSVHGFPVGLVQCENSLLGTPSVGSGGYRHFIEKYLKAKVYGERPFETLHINGRKKKVPTPPEEIRAAFTTSFPEGQEMNEALLLAASATEMPLSSNSLVGVFTDPPYFDNLQYAELMDFCYVWLRQVLSGKIDGFSKESTRTDAELTGNATRGRGLEHFTSGLSAVFQHYSSAMLPGAPFVFTYHHNDPAAYTPLVVSILDAGLNCTATLPAPGEMGASLHISGTGSSILDTVFVCRKESAVPIESLSSELVRDVKGLRAGSVEVTEGDLKCLATGHLARMAINALYDRWELSRPLEERIAEASNLLHSYTISENLVTLISYILAQDEGVKNMTACQHDATL